MPALRILLAEDGLVNQRIAMGFLEMRGHQVTVATTGVEALAILEKQSFDLVLMDVHMPEMDGFEATTTIRAREQTTGRHLPIIALTASAMKGDRERCLEAGMDGYVSKPFNAKELFEAVENCVSNATTEGTENTESASVFSVSSVSSVVALDKSLAPGERNAGESTLDQIALLARVGGNVKLLVEILQLCPGEFARLMNELEIAVSQKDAPRIQAAAHTIKGTLGNLSAADGYEAALRLEEMGRKGDLDRVDEAFRLVQEQVQLVKLAVAKVLKERV